MRIVIDPGHFKNCPNVGLNGYNEGNAMLKLAQYLATDLKRHRFDVILTRGENDVPLTTRGNMAAGADLFISLHSNAGGGRGVECYYSVDLPGDREFAMDLAEVVMTQMNSTLRGTGAKTRPSTVEPGEDYYTVIDAAQDAGCKHVFLIENGFHDNPQDAAYLNVEENLNKIALAIANIICLILKVKYVPITELNPTSQLDQDINVLVSKGIINSADYWRSGSYSTENVQALIHKIALYANK